MTRLFIVAALLLIPANLSRRDFPVGWCILGDHIVTMEGKHLVCTQVRNWSTKPPRPTRPQKPQRSR